MSELGQTPPIPDNPYVGPDAYRKGQVLYGRKRETQELADLLISKRIVLLISPSGAGKTSLIQAALLPRLAPDLQPLPLVRLDRTHPEAPGGANRYLLSALECLESAVDPKQRLPLADLAGMDLRDYLAQRSEPSSETQDTPFRLLVVDQMEELFTLDRTDWAEKDAFIRQLGEALQGTGRGPDAELPLWALLSMREDYVAELEPYLETIPSGLAFRYRLEPLKREQAVEVVTAPAGAFFPRDAAGPLVDDLISLPAADGSDQSSRRIGRFIEPVQLQVVCLRLWNRVVAGEGRPIAPSDIDTGGQGGEVATALTDFYNGVMDEAAETTGTSRRELMDWLESRLISHNKVRTRVLREAGPLDEALRVLVDRHLLRLDLTGDREWIELSHDRLVDPVLNGNQAWREEHLELFQRQAKLWSESGRPDDMLFTGDELDDALQYESEHPRELTPYDRAYLERSRLARQQAEAERERVRQIEAKNAEIKRKNQSLRSQRLWISALGVISFATLIGVAITMFVIKGQKATLESQKSALVESEATLKKAYLELEERSEEIKKKTGELQKSYGKIEDQKIQLGFAQANGWARGGDPAKALPGLIQVAETIQSSPHLGVKPELDQRLIQVLGGHPPVERLLERGGHVVRAMRFASDGTRLFSGGWDDKVTQWSLDGPEARPSWESTRGSDVYGLAYHGASALLACTDSTGTIGLWNVSQDTPKLLATLNSDASVHPGRVSAAAISPDGRWLATSGKGARIQLWDIRDPDQPRPGPRLGARFHQSEVYRLLFLDGGPYDGHLVSADWAGRTGIWQVAPVVRNRPVQRIIAKDSSDRDVAIYSLAASPDGRWIAAGDHAGGILAWDLAAAGGPAQRRLTSTRAHWGAVFDLAFSSDGSRLVSVGADGALVVWIFPATADSEDTFLGRLAARRIEHWGEKLYSLALVPGPGNRIALGGTRTIWLVDIDRPNPLAAQIESGVSTQDWPALTATPDLAVVAALAPDRQTIRIWRSQNGTYKRFRQDIHPGGAVNEIALSPDGRTLVALECNRGLDIWTLPDGDDGAIEGPKSPPLPGSGPSHGCTLAYSPTGESFAIARGSSFTLWNQSTDGDWKIGTQRDVSDGTLSALAFSPDGKRLAGAGTMDRILVWEVDNLGVEPRASESLVEGRITTLAYDPHNRSLVSSGTDLSVVEWRLPELTKTSQSTLHFRRPSALAFGSKAGESMLFSGDIEGQLALCTRPISDARCSPVGSPIWGRIDALVISQDLSRMVVSNRGLWVWDLRRASMLETARRLNP